MDTSPSPADDDLLAEPVLVVRQEWRDVRLPEYHVFDRHEELLAIGRYVPEAELKPLLGSLGLRHRTADALRVVDRHGAVLFTVVFPGFRARGVMLIRNGRDEDIGEAVKTKGIWRVRYELRRRGRPIGAIQVMNRRQSETRVMDRAGTVVATIRTMGAGAPVDFPTDTGGYYLETHHAVEEPLRRVMVATTVAFQAAIGSESVDPQFEIFRLPLLPPRFDPLRRRSAS